MKYGLKDAAIQKICAVFAKFPQVEKAVLYGSRAKGPIKMALILTWPCAATRI